jgi:hypothetical protein
MYRVSHPAIPLIKVLTAFRGYGGRSGSLSVKHKTINYPRREKDEKRTPPIVGDMTTKNFSLVRTPIHAKFEEQYLPRSTPIHPCIR